MSTVMEPKKFASFMEDDSRSFIGRDTYSLFNSRSQPPTPNSLFGRRRSSQSSRSGSVSLDPSTSSLNMSCVTRETSKEDCATQRFIVWAAIRRNTCERMTEDERLECPLLRCTRRFQDHESMLRHLISCDRLEYCEYWCYDHMRIERFDDSRCKKCLGHPSKRRKVLSMAKSFFSSLGHNKGKAVVGQNSFSAASSVTSASLPYSALSSLSNQEFDFDSDYLTRSGSNGSSCARYSSVQSSNSHSGSNCTSRSNSCRRLSDTGDASTSTSASSSKPPFSGISLPPPPRYEDINNRVRAELQATEIVEIDSRELSEMPKQKPIATAPVPAYPLTCPHMPNLTAQSDYVDNITVSTATYQSIPSIAPVTAPTPPPTCPTPSSLMMGSNPTINRPTSINPIDLFLSEHSTRPALPQQIYPEWDANSFSVPGVLGGTGANDAAFQPFFDFYNPVGDATLMRPSLQVSTQSPQFYSQETQSGAPPPPPPARPPRPTSTPATRSKNLSPSSSVRSTTSTTSTTSSTSMASLMSDASESSFMSNATSVISPVSDCTNPWSTGGYTNSTSPTDSLDDIFNEDLFSTEQDVTSKASKYMTFAATDMRGMHDKRDMRDMSNTSGLSNMDMLVDLPMDISSALTSLPAEQMLYNFNQTIMVSPTLQTLPTQVTGVNVSNGISETTSDDSIIDNAETFQDLAASAQDLMFTHVMTSLAKLRDIESSENSLAILFQNASPKHIMDTSISALQAALATGNEAMGPFDTLCFLHLIYSFSLELYKSEAALKSAAIFSQSLEYSRNFSRKDREDYLEIVSLIWQPAGMTTSEVSEAIRRCRNSTLSHNSPVPSTDNVVTTTAMAFLNDLEMSAILVPESASSEMVKASGLFALHFDHSAGVCASSASAADAHNVLESLLHEISPGTDLKTRLQAIGRQLNDGGHATLRYLEINLLQAGKTSLGSSAAYYDTFAPLTTLLCDSVYAANKYATSLRAVFYDADISLLRIAFDMSENVHSGEGMTFGPSMLNTSLLSGDLFSSLVADLSQKDKLQIPVTAPAAPAAVQTLEEVTTEGVSPAALSKSNSVNANAAQEDSLSTKEEVRVEAEDCCELCGYRPKGHPKWFRGSMLKHRMTKHSEEVIYKCSYPGCNSQYRNRPDNLRQHQIEKSHFVGDEAITKKPRKHNRTQQNKRGSNASSSRPVKKRKTSSS